MVEKGIRRGICHTIHRYVKTNNKCVKDYDKNKESSYLKKIGCKQSIWMDGVTKVACKWF